MFTKVLIIVSCLCLVNAFHTINVFDYETTSELQIRSCYQEVCDQTCRRIGFPGGACVGERCKCDILFKDLLKRFGKIKPTLEFDTNTDFSDEKVHGVTQRFRRMCYDVQCDDMCRKLGNTKGQCDVTTNNCNCSHRQILF